MCVCVCVHASTHASPIVGVNSLAGQTLTRERVWPARLGCECTDYFRDVLINLLVPVLRTWNFHFDPIQLTLKGLHISLL